jgi:hypothetical protein
MKIRKSMTNTGKEIPGMFEMEKGGSTRGITPKFDSNPNLVKNQSNLPDFLQEKIIKAKK